MVDVPETTHKPERGRLSVIGHCTDHGEHTTLLLVHEIDGAWTFHGLGARVKVSKADAVALAESILGRAR
ncbi:MAG: hypothetical protein ACRDSF_25140 [Pseudonocardiaceae bacterium]